jgi:IS1 family transposase
LNTEDQLKPYYDFLNECRQKDYSESAIHRHHIIPRFMGGGNEPDNLIDLSIEDHFNAHMNLSNCFQAGTGERWKNICSASKIRSAALRHYRKESIEIPIDIVEFWRDVNIRMKGILKGENNPMYGKTHTKEARAKISAAQSGLSRSEDWRKNHSEKVSGIGNGHYGKSFPHSEETKKKIKETSRLQADVRWPIPTEVFRCEIEIKGKIKRFYRICQCSKTIYYGSREMALNAHENKTDCRSCMMSRTRKGVKIKNTENMKGVRGPNFKLRETLKNVDRKGKNNSRAMIILDNQTGIFYETQSEFSEVYQFGYCSMKSFLKKNSDRFEIIENGRQNAAL